MRVISSPLSMSSRARFQPTLPPPTMRTYIAAAALAGLQVEGLAEHVDRVLRGRDRLEPLLAVPGRARRVHDAAQDAADVEAPLGDLADDDVRVVAVGGRDEALGAVDARLEQRVDLQRGADGEQAAAVLPRAIGPDIEAFVGERVLVEDGYLVTGRERGFRHGRPDASRTDDQHEHERGETSGRAYQRWRSARRRPPAARPGPAARSGSPGTGTSARRTS